MTMAVAGEGRLVKTFYDSTGVSTADANETNLFVNTALVASGYINLGKYTGGWGILKFGESAGYAGTLKVYMGQTQSATQASQVGSNVTITASGGDQPIVIAVLPQFLRVTITRSTSNITVPYRLELHMAGVM